MAWLAQQMAKTPIAGLLRIGWDTVGWIVQRVVADRLDENRLEGAPRAATPPRCPLSVDLGSNPMDMGRVKRGASLRMYGGSGSARVLCMLKASYERRSKL